MEAESADRFPWAVIFFGGLCLVTVATLVIVILMYVKLGKLSSTQRPSAPGQYPQAPPPSRQYPSAPPPPPAQPHPGPPPPEQPQQP